MIKQAKLLRMTGIGIADRNTVAGVVRAHVQAKELNKQIRELNIQLGMNEPELKLAVGARLEFTAKAAPIKANAFSLSTTCLNISKASISLSCPSG